MNDGRLNIFFAEDICNALLAAEEASASTAQVCIDIGGNSPSLQAYLEGYRAALTTVALAFGISPRIFGGRAAGAEDKVHVFNMPFAVLDDE